MQQRWLARPFYPVADIHTCGHVLLARGAVISIGELGDYVGRELEQVRCFFAGLDLACSPRPQTPPDGALLLLLASTLACFGLDLVLQVWLACSTWRWPLGRDLARAVARPVGRAGGGPWDLLDCSVSPRRLESEHQSRELGCEVEEEEGRLIKDAKGGDKGWLKGRGRNSVGSRAWANRGIAAMARRKKEG